MKSAAKPNSRPVDPTPIQSEVLPKSPHEVAAPIEEIEFPFATSDVLFAAWPAFRRDEQ